MRRALIGLYCVSSFLSLFATGAIAREAQFSFDVVQRELIVLDEEVEDRFVIDGDLYDWANIQRFRFTQKVDGFIPRNTDLAGSLAIALDRKSLYIALDISDESLRPGAGGDRVVMRFLPPLSLEERKRARAGRRSKAGLRELTMTLSAGRELTANFRFGARRLTGGKIITTQSDRGFTVEARLPRSQLEPLVGPAWAFAALYFDRDRSGGDSIYSTHFVNKQKLPLQESLALGVQAAAQLAFEESARRPLDPLKSFRGQPSRRLGDVTFHITDRELAAFGRLPRQGRFQYVFHNWGAKPEILSIRLKNLGDGPHKSLIIEHKENPVPNVRLKIIEFYSFIDGHLQRRFAHELEQSVEGEGRASATLKMRGKPAEISLSKTRIEGLDEGNAHQILSSPGLRPLLFPWRPKNGARRFQLKPSGWIPQRTN